MCGVVWNGQFRDMYTCNVQCMYHVMLYMSDIRVNVV